MNITTINSSCPMGATTPINMMNCLNTWSDGLFFTYLVYVIMIIIIISISYSKDVNIGMMYGGLIGTIIAILGAGTGLVSEFAIILCFTVFLIGFAISAYEQNSKD
jgi:hypothetical protein